MRDGSVMNNRDAIELYYSYLLGANENLFAQNVKGPVFLYTSFRDYPLPGYGQCLNFLAIKTWETLIISYGDMTHGKIPQLEKLLRKDDLPLYEAIHYTFGMKPEHSIKYIFNGNIPGETLARPLTSLDYPAYETFFRTNNPNVQDISWLRSYFDEMTADGLCCGVFVNRLLVSCTDSPTVPYMTESIREIGINTLEKYRNRGFAKSACACAVREILRQGKHPLWSTGIENIASQRLASALGFEPFGESFAISLKK